MQTQQLDETTKAVIIEVMDIFNELGVEELPENYPEEKEREAHVKVINQLLKQARSEGYTKYALYNHEEAEAKGHNLGIRGVYLIIFKK